MGTSSIKNGRAVHSNTWRLGLLLGASLASPAWGQPAPAPQQRPAPPDGTKVEEIVVTATKRPERLQRVPITVTVVGGAQLLHQNVTTVDDLARTAPSVTSTTGPAGAVSIRGIGTQTFARSAEGSVGIVIDNVALANATASVAPTALFDVQRVEILEGPQGTLFGRNSSAGVLNVITNPPVFNQLEASTHIDVGSRDGLLTQDVVNIPLGDTAALRLAGHYTRQPETIYSAYRGQWDQDDDEGVRGRLKWQPNDDLTINVIGDYDGTHNRNDTFAVSNDTPGGFLARELATCGITASTSNNRTCLDGPVYSTLRTYGVSGQIDYRLGDYTLTSISAGRWLISPPSGLDSDSVPVNVLNTNYSSEHLNNVSQELRLTSPGTGPLQYVLGLFYFNSNAAFDGGQAGMLNIPFLNFLKTQAGQTFVTTGNTQSDAAFGQATYRVFDNARLIAGGRLDREDVSAQTTRALYPGALFPFTIITPIDGHDVDTNFSYKIGGQYDLTPETMGYVTYTRGYKGPAINDQSTSLTAPVIVRPEIPHDVDLGVKTSVLQGKLALDLSLYHDQVTNFQTTIFDPTTAGFIFGTAPSLTSQGVELTAFGRPLPGLSFNGGINYTDATYGNGYFVPCGPTQTASQGCATTVTDGKKAQEADAQGNRLIGSPRWKITLSGEYDHALDDRFDGFVQLDGVFTSSINFNASYDPLDTTGDHFQLGGRIGVRTHDGRYGIALYGRNLTDDRVPTFVVDTPLAAQLGDINSHAQYFGPDSFRLFGVTLDARF